MRSLLLVICLMSVTCYSQKTTLKISAERNFLKGVVVDLDKSKSDSILYFSTLNYISIRDSLGNDINDMVSVSISKPHYVREDYYRNRFYDSERNTYFYGKTEKVYSIILIDNSLARVKIKSNFSDDKIEISYQTSEMPERRLKIGPFLNQEIPIDKLNVLDSLSIFSYDIDFLSFVTSYEMVINGTVHSITGNKITDEIKKALLELKVGDELRMQNIKYTTTPNKYGRGGGNNYILPFSEFYIRKP